MFEFYSAYWLVITCIIHSNPSTLANFFMFYAHTQSKSYSMEELQSMFTDMAKGFEYPNWSYSPHFQWPSFYESSQWGQEPSTFNDSGNSNRSRSTTYPMAGTNSHIRVSNFHMYWRNPFCKFISSESWTTGVGLLSIQGEIFEF